MADQKQVISSEMNVTFPDENSCVETDAEITEIIEMLRQQLKTNRLTVPSQEYDFIRSVI